MAIYLDHAATTPMLPAAIDAYARQMAQTGNASSLHAQGRAVRKAVEESRELIAKAAGCDASEIIFTASGTEANNLAIKGFFWSNPSKKTIVVSAIEHHAVIDPVEWLKEHEGAKVIYAPVDNLGVLDLTALEKIVSEHRDDIAVIAIMHSNNEVGTIQPIADVVKIAGDIPVHTDAVQSFGKIVFDFKALGVTSATISAHKLGGPLGVAALILKRGLDITPLLHGGGQERDIRSSTVNAPGIVSFATAVDQALSNLRDNYSKMSSLQFQLREDILREVPDARINGWAQEILPNILNVTFPGTKNESLLVLLDMAGISASQGSACSAGVQRPSHVLLAMGLSEKEADSTVRFSLGHTSTQEDIDALCGVIADVVKRAIK
ncbi:MAG: cysteine desulfurase family protein [Actinomycetes bacterium]